jgi:drug/metabolite transporter (DMT)-like permease
VNEARPNPRLAWLQLAIAVVLFGLSWPILKMTLAAATPVWMAAARAGLSCLAAFVLLGGMRRLTWPTRADWPIVLSVGLLQLTCFFAFANLGVQVLPAGRSGVLAYTTMLWMVPLSLVAREHVGWRGIAGTVLGLVGIVVLIDPLRFDWSQRNILLGHGWLLAGGFAWALAIFHSRHHRWRMTPLQALPWQMAVAAICLWILALIFEPNGHLDFDRQVLWWGLLYIGVLAGPTATWAAVSVARALPPITGSLGMLGVPLLGIAASVLLLGEPITLSLALGTALVIAGIAIVLLDRTP